MAYTANAASAASSRIRRVAAASAVVSSPSSSASARAATRCRAWAATRSCRPATLSSSSQVAARRCRVARAARGSRPYATSRTSWWRNFSSVSAATTEVRVATRMSRRHSSSSDRPTSSTGRRTIAATAPGQTLSPSTAAACSTVRCTSVSRSIRLATTPCTVSGMDSCASGSTSPPAARSASIRTYSTAYIGFPAVIAHSRSASASGSRCWRSRPRTSPRAVAPRSGPSETVRVPGGPPAHAGSFSSSSGR